MTDRHFWDTCCWLDFVAETDAKQPMTMLWGAVTRGAVELLFSPIVLAETLFRPPPPPPFPSAPRPWPDPHPTDAIFETPGLVLVQIDRPVGERARSIRRAYNLKAPDALHLACAIEHNVDLLITRDAGDLLKLPSLRRKDGLPLKIVPPSQALNGDLFAPPPPPD